MCTLSLIRECDAGAVSLAQGRALEGLQWRVMFNRDERRSRPPALAPTPHRHGDVRAIYPVDPLGGGTWIAVSSAGFVFALLNEYSIEAPVSRRAAAESRGQIIPSLLGSHDVGELASLLRGIDARRYLPFRLVVMTGGDIRELIGDGRSIRATAPTTASRWMRTSSSVRSQAIQAHRRALFRRRVTQASYAAQDSFHRVVCRSQPEAGIRMSRADARTVSVTAVDVFADRVQMTYRPLEPDDARR